MEEDFFFEKNRHSIKNTNNSIKKKELSLMESNELKSMLNPIKKAVYKAEHGNIYTGPINNGYKYTNCEGHKTKQKANPKDRLACEICGGSFIRYNRIAHNRTKVHQAFHSMNEKMRKLLIDK